MPSRYKASTVQFNQPKSVRTVMLTAVTSVERMPGLLSPLTTTHRFPQRTTAAPARANLGERLSVTQVSVIV